MRYVVTANRFVFGCTYKIEISGKEMREIKDISYIANKGKSGIIVYGNIY